ncbi:hypothetical protein KM043_013650 [Ampulex compressa]|nr:hypothetical protein KM043_013650 [Ampulex compressa]
MRGKIGDRGRTDGTEADRSDSVDLRVEKLGTYLAIGASRRLMVKANYRRLYEVIESVAHAEPGHCAPGRKREGRGEVSRRAGMGQKSAEVGEVALPLTPPPVAQCTSNKLSAAVIALRLRRRGVSFETRQLPHTPDMTPVINKTA